MPISLLLGACHLIGGIDSAEPECRLDGVTSGLETDLDCGGPCDPCADGLACVDDEDCRSVSCEEGLCQPSTCYDGRLNGTETDVDCGGTSRECPRCGGGEACLDDFDCGSIFLARGVLGVPACEEGFCMASCTAYDCEGCDELIFEGVCAIQWIDPAAADCCPTTISEPGFRGSPCDGENPNSCYWPYQCFGSGFDEFTCL